MTKVYNIKSSKDLFDRWTKVIKKTNKKINPQRIIQNDMETTSDELNKWFTDSLEELVSVDKDFKEIMSELFFLRQDTINYLKAQVAKESNRSE